MELARDDPRRGGIALSRILHAANAYVGATTVSFCVMEDTARGTEGSLESIGLGAHLAGVLREYENELEAIRPYF